MLIAEGTHELRYKLISLTTTTKKKNQLNALLNIKLEAYPTQQPLPQAFCLGTKMYAMAVVLGILEIIK